MLLSFCCGTVVRAPFLLLCLQSPNLLSVANFAGNVGCTGG